MEDAELANLFTEESQTEKEHYETLAGYFNYFEQELKKPGATLGTLHEEYLLKHPAGYRYTQFCWHIRQWKRRTDPNGKLSHKAADKLFIDGKKLSYIDKASGEIVEAEVFIAALPCSQYTFEGGCFPKAGRPYPMPEFLPSLARWCTSGDRVG